MLALTGEVVYSHCSFLGQLAQQQTFFQGTGTVTVKSTSATKPLRALLSRQETQPMQAKGNQFENIPVYYVC